MLNSIVNLANTPRRLGDCDAVKPESTPQASTRTFSFSVLL